jgi:hypothetical protein
MLFKRQMQPQLQLGAGERRLQQAAAGARAGPGPSDVQRHLSYQCALFQQRQHRQRARRRSCRRRRRKRGKEERPTVAPRDSGATTIGGDADLWKDGGSGDAKISDGDDADWRRTRPRPRRRQRSPLIVATARWQTEAGRHRNSPARIQNQRVKQIWFIPPLRSTKGDGPNNALHRAVVIERHDACDSTSTT